MKQCKVRGNIPDYIINVALLSVGATKSESLSTYELNLKYERCVTETTEPDGRASNVEHKVIA